jgi:ribosome maturation factor RimP
MKVDTEKIGALAARVAEDEVLELFDLHVGSDGSRTVIRVFVDRAGGVTLGDIESFSRKMGAVLEVEDPVEGPYVLEVSSPGIDRRLSRPAHFAGALGKRIRVALGEPLEGCRNISGTMVGSDGEGIEVDRGDRRFRIPYGAIKKANLEVSQEELFGKVKGRKKR